MRTPRACLPRDLKRRARRWVVATRWLFTLAGLVGVPTAIAHELPDNRATFVLREGRHLSLSLRVQLPQALHQALAPAEPFGTFVLAASALPAEAFAARWARVQRDWEQQARPHTAQGAALPLQRWQWPKPEQVQDQLRQAAMQMATGAPHTHAAPTEVKAELQAPAMLNDLRWTAPPAFGRVMLVWYAPQQAWAAPGQASTLRFGRESGQR